MLEIGKKPVPCNPRRAMPRTTTWVSESDRSDRSDRLDGSDVLDNKRALIPISALKMPSETTAIRPPPPPFQ